MSPSANRWLNFLVFLMPKGFNYFLLVTTDKLAAYEKTIANHLTKVRYVYLRSRQTKEKKATGYSQKTFS